MASEEETLLLDGLDAALVGLGRIQTGPPLAVYSQTRILEALEAQGMDEDEALEWFLFNVQGAYVGEQTPLIMLMVEELEP